MLLVHLYDVVSKTLFLVPKVEGNQIMTHKHLRNIAIFIFIVFGLTIVVYPLIFGTNPRGKSEPPVELELQK